VTVGTLVGIRGLSFCLASGDYDARNDAKLNNGKTVGREMDFSRPVWSCIDPKCMM
jgi:hypothetical protein